MTTLNLIQTFRRNGEPLMTIHRSGRIIFSRMAVERLNLDAGQSISFYSEEVEHAISRLWLQPHGGHIPLRALPNRRQLQCNCKEFASMVFVALGPEQHNNTLWQCRIQTPMDYDKMMYEICINPKK